MQTSVTCPYCGEENTIQVDESGGDNQHYVEDCQVCCKPWRVAVMVDQDGEVNVELQAEAE